jgi:hypothetical protein
MVIIMFLYVLLFLVQIDDRRIEAEQGMSTDGTRLLTKSPI